MPQPFTYVSDNAIDVGGVTILIDDGKTDALFRGKNRDDAYFMAKSRWYLDSYEFLHRTFRIPAHPNILELGIYKGGSAVFLDRVYSPKKLVCVDYMQEPSAALTRYIREEKTGDRIKTYYGTDQADKQRLKKIIDTEFDGPIDIVIDDASHWYEESRASFEAIFPVMRPGGLFLLEDWTWAHGPDAQKPDHYWAQKKALTNLVFQMTMAHAESMAIIQRMMFLTGLVLVEKGPARLPRDWTLDAYERPRGKELGLI